jgi:hypothetical protein
MKNVLDMKKLFERRIKMRKLLLLVFVAAMCVPSYGDILVYKTTQTATVLDITVPASLDKVTEKGFLVLDVDLTTQDVCEAQQITYTGKSGATLRALNAMVVFHNEYSGNIVADYSSGNTNAILFGKTSDGKAVGLTGKDVARTLRGYTVDFMSPTFSSGTFSATLDTRTTKSNQSTLIDNLVSNLITDLDKYTLVTDTTPPDPNPAMFLPGGEPNAISDTQIIMTAKEATDALNPPVQYYFTNKTLAGHDSGWIPETTFTDSGLTSNTTYKYNVRAQDSKVPNANVTLPSADANATTHAIANTTPPDPNPPAFSSRPATLSDTSIIMSAGLESDAQGPVEYYFRNKHFAGHDSGWKSAAADSTNWTASTRTWIDTGLAPDGNYGYTVQARDNALAPRNYTAESNEANAVTGHDVTAPDPNPATFVIAPHQTGTTSITMQATIATDSSIPVWYQFRRFNPDASTTLSAWQNNDSNFIDAGLTENTTYSYQVRTKDSATTVNTGAWSIATPSATTSKTIRAYINEAKAGRTDFTTRLVVTIPDGTYNENLEINEPNMTLQSTTGAANTIIQLQNTDVNGIRVIAVGDTIGGSSGHGFTIKSAATGTISVIDINQNNTVVSYCDINGIPGVATRGVRMTKADGVTIGPSNNFFVDGNGVSLGGGPGYPLKTISITGNTFTSLGPTGSADTNSFVTIEGSDACNVQITGNTTNDGMVVQVGPNDTNLISINISTNTFNTGGILLCEVIGGAVGEPCDANRLQSMTITGNTFAAGSNGYALLIPSGAVLTTVALEPNDVNWATGLTFANNKVLRSPGGPTYKTVDNLIGGTTTMKTAALNAKRNWWGSATGPTGGCPGGIGASITTPPDVNYLPFWQTATGTEVNCP